MKVQGWLLTIATIITMAAVIVYTIVTYKLHGDAKRELVLLENDISLSRTPILSLGAHDDEAAYINNIENLDDYSESQIDKHIGRMKASGERVFLSIGIYPVIPHSKYG